jgi:hypothetical protein
MTGQGQDRLEVLKLVYQDILTECDRLRSARAAVTGRLGPLPASAGIVLALVGSVADQVGLAFLITAGGRFVALVAVSVMFGGVARYRLLRAKHLPTEPAQADQQAESAPKDLGFRNDPRSIPSPGWRRRSALSSGSTVRFPTSSDSGSAARALIYKQHSKSSVRRSTWSNFSSARSSPSCWPGSSSTERVDVGLDDYRA